MTTVPIEAATVRDVPAIRRVADWSFHAAYGDLLDADLIGAMLDAWYESARLRGQITDPETVFLVVRRGGRVRGFAEIDPHDGPGAYFLSRLYVEPSLWGDGIGSELLSSACGRLGEDRRRLELTVLDGNDRAVRFYEDRDFEYVRTETTTLGPFEIQEHVYRKEFRNRRQC